MKRSGLFIALAAAGMFLGGARGVLADHQRSGDQQNHQGSRYQQSDRHAQPAVTRDARQGRGDGWRADAADRTDHRGQGQWGQSPFGYIVQTDREQRGTYRSNGGHRDNHQAWHRGDRDHDRD